MADAIVYAYTDDVFRAEWSLRVVSPDGTDLGAIETPVEAWLPSWSPDHSYVAFEVPTPTGTDIGVVACDGTGFKMLTDDGVSGAPAWSVDGSRIAFISRADVGHLEVIAPDGTDRVVVETLSVPVQKSRVAWVPRGTGPGSLAIVFVGATDADNDDLYVVNDEGVGRAVVSPLTEGEPSVAPDAHAWAFFSSWNYLTNAPGDADQAWVAILAADPADGTFIQHTSRLRPQRGGKELAVVVGRSNPAEQPVVGGRGESGLRRSRLGGRLSLSSSTASTSSAGRSL